jgi:hypothetical protein
MTINFGKPFKLIAENIYGEKHIVDFYPTEKRARTAAKMIGSKLQKVYIYDSNDICIDVYE